jgi:plasmid replication initiation protein
MDISKEKLIVVKHNDLIKSAYRLSIIESRIILSCIAQVNSMGKLSFTDKFSVSVSDIVDLLEAGENADFYANLKQALDRLSDRWVYFIEPSSRSGERKTRWVYSVDYVPQSGCIDLFFSPHIIPFLSELKNNFTQYKLEHVLKFKSSYGLRIYEIIKSSKNGTVTIELEWLKKVLELPPAYDRTGHLQDRVLKPSIIDINNTSDLTVSYEPVKTGRKITAFKFTFVCLEDKKAKSKPKPKFSQDRIDGVLKADLEKYAKPGESYSQAATRIKAEQLMLEKNGKPKTVDIVW